MRIWKRSVIGVASAAVIATGAIAAFAANGTQPAHGPTTSVDVKGPCDETEHANDPRCDGPQVAEDRDRAHDRNDINGGQNEAEPNDDNGGAGEVEPGDDNSAMHGADDGPNHDAYDDNRGESGSSGQSDNSGPGSGSDDHSGSGDNSGPGSSSSGSGSSGGDD